MTRDSVILAFSLFAAMVWLVDEVITRQNSFLFNFVDQVFAISANLPVIPFVNLEWLVELWVLLGTLWLLSVGFWVVITLCFSTRSRGLQRAVIFGLLLIPVGISSAHLADDGASAPAITSVQAEITSLYKRAEAVFRR
ncbi:MULTISPECIES: hypothetical protein [Marinobacter]|uniref:hypothetical protein n=1 Tax=Marinobacter TaxID=2742 RepID=UPI001C9565D2|nr:hypothetical protein [Marinobacter nauticus]MBY6104721.1 hypothetical protein [Marinobacter nauticus]